MKTYSLGAVAGLLMLGGCSQPPKPLIVGSRLALESAISGEIMAQHIRNKLGIPVELRPAMMGAISAHQALLSGEVNLYAEDAGSAYYAIFRLPVNNDPDIVNSRVALEYQNTKVRWMAPLGYLSRYVVAADAAKVKEATLSQLAESDAPVAIAYTLEFSTRRDGFAALMAAYKLHLSGVPRVVEPNQVADQLIQKLSHIAVVNEADPVLLNSKVKVLEDDKKVFFGYPVAIVVLERTLAANARLEGVLKMLEGKMSQEAIRKLGSGVKTQGKTVAAVAAEFLHGAGLK